MRRLKQSATWVGKEPPHGVVSRNERAGIWSQSKTATNSPSVMRSSGFRLPALAYALSERVM